MTNREEEEIKVLEPLHLSSLLSFICHSIQSEAPPGASLWQAIPDSHGTTINDSCYSSSVSSTTSSFSNKSDTASRGISFFHTDAMPCRVASSNIGPDSSFWPLHNSTLTTNNSISYNSNSGSLDKSLSSQSSLGLLSNNEGNGGSNHRISSDRHCNNCNTVKTSKWYKDHLDVGKYICKKCYNHRYKERNRFG